LVISCLNPKPKSYANSLLSAVELLARPVLRPPAMASEINSGGVLERRFKMIISENARRPNTRWLQACILLCATVALPLGIASAQDYEAVGRRLRAAVEAGELTGEQARAMLGALRNAGSAEKDQGSDRVKAYLMKVKKDLGVALEAGEISREDAAKRYEAAEKGIKERMAAGRSQGDSTRITREDYARAEAELRTAVAEGRTSPEDARSRLQGMRNMIVDQGERQRGEERTRITREDWEGIGKRIKGAVESGRMTHAEADAKYRELREQMSRGEGAGDKRAGYGGFERRIRAAVEAGKMTREEAGEQLEGYRRRMAMADQTDRGRGDGDALGRITQVLIENGIAREQVRGVLGALRPIIGEMQSEGNAFELDPGVRERLAGMGLTSEQIDFVVGFARRLANRPAN
jgi:polyhydroxyalkanoate synthesis regulator phasin